MATGFRARDERLARSERMGPHALFLAVQRGGRRLGGGRCYSMTALARPEGVARLGVTVSRKVGNAVVRNRVKRWLRESYRRNKDLVAGVHDIVVVARPEAANAGFAATDAELRRLLGRVGTPR